MRKVVAGIALFIIFIITTTSLLSVKACISPYDNYAYEILMNKPGISFNIEKLRQLCVEVGSKYIKPSITDSRVFIIIYSVDLKELNLGEGLAYSIRFQVNPKLIDKKVFIATYLIKHPILPKEGIITDINELFIVKRKYTIEDNKFVEVAEITVVNINPKVSLAEFIEDSLNKISSKFNIPVEYIKVCDVRETSVKAIDVKTEIPWSEVVFKELIYLSEEGIIEGLEQSDIETLSEMAKPGLAGWNSRIVYQETWKPYYETSNPLLIKTLCGPRELEYIAYLEMQAERQAATYLPPVPSYLPPMPPTPTPTPSPTAMPTTPGPSGVAGMQRETYTYTETGRVELITPAFIIAQTIIGGLIAALIVWFILRRLTI